MIEMLFYNKYLTSFMKEVPRIVGLFTGKNLAMREGVMTQYIAKNLILGNLSYYSKVHFLCDQMYHDTQVYQYFLTCLSYKG